MCRSIWHKLVHHPYEHKHGRLICSSISKDSGMQDMYSMNMDGQKNNNIVLAFFSSQWGDALLVASSALMLLGIWFSGKMKLIPLAVLGIVLMFVGMYWHYSISLQITGAAIMGFAHLSNYNYKISKLLRI